MTIPGKCRLLVVHLLAKEPRRYPKELGRQETSMHALPIYGLQFARAGARCMLEEPSSL